MALPGVYYGPQGDQTPPRRYAPPSPTLSQVEQRERRRGRLPVRYGQKFSLVCEIADVLTPLAARLLAADDDARGRLADDTLILAEATHSLLSDVAGWVAADAMTRRARQRGMAERDVAKTARLAGDAAARPRLPEVDRDSLKSGAWCKRLCDAAAELSGPLSELLGRATPALVGPVTNANANGAVAVSVSDRLVEALRPVDRAAADLKRALGWDVLASAEAERARELRKDRELTSNKQARARAELAQMGIDA